MRATWEKVAHSSRRVRAIRGAESRARSEVVTGWDVRAFEPASSQDVGAPPTVVSGSRAQAQGREQMPALDSSAVGGVEGERASARERSSLCPGAPSGAGGTPLKGASPVHGPGSSNTGPKTPPNRPKMMQYGVDTLHIAFRCEFPHSLFVRLQRAAPEKGIKGSIAVEGESFEVKRAGEGYKLATVECAIMVSKDPNGFHLKFEAGALFLRRLGLEYVCTFAKTAAEKLTCQTIEEHRVRRVDLFIDVAGVNFTADDLPAFVSRAHREHGFHAHDKLHHSKVKGAGPKLTGFTFSPGNPLMVRLYDKLAELHSVAGEDSVKFKTELATYTREGWQNGQDVWRLEAQLRTEALKKRGVCSMGDLIRLVSEVWDYCFSGSKPWLRLVVPGSASRVERQRLDERWVPFQENPFGKGSFAAPEVDGDLGGVSAEQALGVLQSFLGSKRALPDLDGDLSLEDLVEHDLDCAKRVILENLKKTRADAHKSRGAVRARYRLIPLEAKQ